MPLSPIRIGIIGAGANTRKMHLPLLQKIEGVTVTEVANRTRSSSERVAAEFNIPRVREHWRDIIDSKEVDAVVIGTWPYLHAEATCAALEAGKHVLCEARMAMNAAEARKMLAASRRHPRLTAQLVPSPFTLRVDRTVQRILGEGGLGALRHFSFQFCGPPPMPPRGPLHWRRDHRLSGMNTLVLGIAYESLLRWLGPAEQVRALARVFQREAVDPDTGQPVEVEVPDYLTVQIEMPGSLLGTFTMFESGAPGPPNRYQLFGDRAMLEVDFQPGGGARLGRAGEKTLHPVDIPPEEAGGWRVEEEFINAIRGKETVTYTPFETGVDYMVFTEAVYRSWTQGGKTVALDTI